MSFFQITFYVIDYYMQSEKEMKNASRKYEAIVGHFYYYKSTRVHFS